MNNDSVLRWSRLSESVLLVGLKNDLDIRWDCVEPRLILVSPNLPQTMERETSQWSIDSFELKEALYKGAASLVYLALDRVSNTDVVLKLYRKTKLNDLSRFQVEREIIIHSSIQHEYIINYHAAFEDDKYVYLMQEYAEKGDLFCMLKQMGGFMREAQAVQEVLYPFMCALSYLHAQGILHRDIKPENIFVMADNTIKVADFGLSINEKKERPVTRAGTLDYMPPEVLGCPDKAHPADNKNNKSLTYSTKVDVWAVGVLAYELVTGAPPFENESRSATYEQIMFKDPQYPDSMTEHCKDFISRALQKSGSVRPTIQALLGKEWIYMNKKKTSYDLSSVSSISAIDDHSYAKILDTELIKASREPDSLSLAKTEESTAHTVVREKIEELSLSTSTTVSPPLSDEKPKQEPLVRKSTLKSKTSSTDSGTISRKASVKFNLSMADESLKPPSGPSHRLKLQPSSKSEDSVGQFGQISRLDSKGRLGGGFLAESHLTKGSGSLNLIHKFFSQSEEEDSGKRNPELESELQRLPSFAFFPKQQERDFRPAHRLSRELTGTAVSFTQARKPIKDSEAHQTPPSPSSGTTIQSSPPSKQAKKQPFFKFGRKKGST